MKYYIVVDEEENKIMKVQDKDIAMFKKEYGSKIVVEGDSIEDLLIKLSGKFNTEDKNIPAEIFR